MKAIPFRTTKDIVINRWDGGEENRQQTEVVIDHIGTVFK